MRHIAVETDAFGPGGAAPIEARTQNEVIAAAAARAICNAADDVDAKAVVVRTRSGWMARLLSKFRLSRPVIALTPNETVRRRIALYFGIIPLQADYPDEIDAQIAQVDRILIDGRWAEPGDLIVIGLGPRAVANGDSGSIIIHSIDQGDS
jgi:pyruvate kinase